MTNLPSFVLQQRGLKVKPRKSKLHAANWEKTLNVILDNSFATKSDDIQAPANSFDFVFCYAAAHHFPDMQKTLEEIYRILKPGGTCFFFHEPTSNRMLYKMAYKRVNTVRNVVHEDLLIPKVLQNIAMKTGFEMKLYYDPSITKRAPLETLYYFVILYYQKSHF